MARPKRKTLVIDACLSSLAFDRDVVYHDSSPRSTYLDKDSGDVHWVYDDDEDAEFEEGAPAADNSALRRQIAKAPHRFLEISGRDHGEHHDLLREFLSSDWTEDESLHEQARTAYSGSIGRWKDAVADATIHAFYDFRERRLREMAEDFLREHGIEPAWK